MKKIIRSIRRRTETEPLPQTPRIYVPTGSTLLNLLLSDKANGGYLVGKINNIVGDSSSGKTILALTTLSAAANDEAFNDYDLIYDDAEAANEFNFRKLFGKIAESRIMPPSLNKEEPEYSDSLTAFQYNIRRRLKSGKPFIYVQDSFDALTTKQEMEHADDVEKAFVSGKEAKGTYGMEKAKQASILLRLLVGEIKKTNSLVIIISQTRDNIDPMSFQRKTRAGGKALYFYCSYEMWMAVAGKIKVKVKDKNRQIGVLSKIKVTKNKSSGKLGEVDVPIYYSIGVDDISSCIDFLVEEKHWQKKAGYIEAREFGARALHKDLIETIEQKNWEKKLQRIVEMVWNEIQEGMELKRKGRWE